ncbi:putative methylase [Legionella geestiana]|uniref:Ribosomal RNA small subunit methyltransferase D n=1 Tax=Legionella geestiana TaxID=45065 RepID=A0A0W0TMT1_9GAMM|nr:16S rRNA (guanine(966)-N(2))-methyltransferase RsmD [Legionella geestiana]KTC96533.1 putative methylase [Legionella geestiana]QBS12570.1 16S rRNA (guanine(966)-N(2))-methyltransferase RsmD [Legionella geestiana]QDQ39714.1 16S rRNA (guanine(966)-N(2))-methyltransferase RsmD [Legionella geestiana]STX54979.1 putative methylase [Legionella geestiana]
MKPGIRIIGGRFRGRKIPVPDCPGLRPTTDRVRETLFNWLMPRMHEARCLDAFAGSGALGFEALSRGANAVVMLEKDAKAHASLQRVAETLKRPELQIIKTDTCIYLAEASTAFDIIFLDPPYHAGLLESCLAHIEKNRLLTAEGVLYVEAAAPLSPPAAFQVLREGRAGLSHYALWIWSR